MKATEILMEEHRVIERVLDAVEAAVNLFRQGKSVRPEFFIEATDFVKGFADGCHHKKEEGVLFPTMVENGVPVEGGPIGVMLAEHEEGRTYARSLRQAAQSRCAGDESARETAVENALGYVNLLRQHIQKEDHILFPLANSAIPLPEQERLPDAFERVEHDKTGEEAHEKYLALADALENEVRQAK